MTATLPSMMFPYSGTDIIKDIYPSGIPALKNTTLIYSSTMVMNTLYEWFNPILSYDNVAASNDWFNIRIIDVYKYSSNDTWTLQSGQ